MTNLEKGHGIELAKAEGSAASIYMGKVYRWMTGGLTATALTAYMVASSPAMMRVIFSNAWLAIGLFIAQIALVVVLSAAVHKMSAMTASLCFLAYSVLTGVTFSSIFAVYAWSSIAQAFFSAAGMFLAMSIYGAVTKKDLSGLGSFCFMGLIGILIAMTINIFWQNSMMDLIVSCIGAIVFTGLTAFDTQKLVRFGENAPLDDGTAVHRGVILGALTLYLDFINLFLMLLRLFGHTSGD